jgi:hypothetical protein
MKACMALTQAEFEAARTSFFPSIKATLNHILTVDWLYIDALEREERGDGPHPDYLAFFTHVEPFGTCVGLRAAQAQSDLRLIEYCKRLTDDSLGREITILRGDLVQRETRERILAQYSCTRSTTAGRCMRCWPGPRSRRPSLTNFSARWTATRAPGTSASLAGPRNRCGASGPDWGGPAPASGMDAPLRVRGLRRAEDDGAGTRRAYPLVPHLKIRP